MIILSCNNINKSFGIDTILENVSFAVNEGDTVGLVGVNGTGKTTLFNIISGKYGYDSGDIYISKNTTIGYLYQNPDFDSNKTVLDEVLTVFEHLMKMENDLRNLEILISNESKNSEKLESLMNEYSSMLEEFSNSNGYGYKSEARGTLKGLGFNESDFDKKIDILSGGEKTRVLLAKLLLTKPDLLLLDEPTNHLDTDAIEWLENFIKQYKGTIFIISHDRYFLDQTVNKIFELHNKNLRTYTGNYSDYIKKSYAEKEIELKKYEQQQTLIKKQQDVIDKLKSFGREKHIKRARSREKALEKIDVLDKPQMYRKKAKIRFFPQVSSGYEVLSVSNLCMKYDDKLLFKDISFDIYKGEKVALIGPNGTGKSTIFKILMKEISQTEGTFKLGTNVNIGYYHQEQKTLNLENTIIDEVWQANPSLSQTEIRTVLASFLFEGEEVFKEIYKLSGGEKGRVALAKLMLSKANFLLLDEPTNHLDIDSKQALEDALSNYDGTVFVISHDRYFLNKIADKILVLKQDKIEEYLGNYDYYIEKRNELREMALEDTHEKSKTKLKEERKKEKEKKQLEKKQKLEREKIEKEIENIENEIENIDTLMCLEEVYSDEEKSRQLSKKRALLSETLEDLYSKWESFL
ncbi:ATP-binding cassette, subfamily F, member 3 [Alkalithermobacter thermoalcaliphilus JW-YL-7 = DSM 7308]|uniref:ABC transporter related protein n=1 Tax=Alkalithermobacter thermoalcaliphilus JW-YL-7 = DSM 7308 TaxID=1121328 RepID=A0A150FNA7_CLOPD|nr:ABC transporter related protein [[Clostridium] paradoxum JW-YL-7 = DSM 7308]SHL06963.1 ATP-binding cassette, subfamily F, member 3 [[Clostridium] paradoxum JW-YL-7 = DSM 7308]